MKTKVKRLSKRSLAVFLGLMMLVTSLGIGSIITANAAVNWNDYGGNKHHYIYYDDSTANISAGGTKNVYAMMGYSGGSNVFEMTRVSDNTLLYSLDYDNKWTGCKGFGVKGASSAPSGAVTSADRYTESGDFNGNATVFAYGSKTGTTLTANAWTANNGDEKASVKNNVTLGTKVADAGSSDYSETDTTIATLGLSSVYWNSGSVSSKGAASGFANGSVTYNDAVGAGAIDFSYSDLDASYTFKGWYDSSGNKLSESDTYSGYQQGHVSAITYYAYFQKVANYTGITAVAKGTTDSTNYSVNLGTIQSSTTVSSTTGLAVNAGTQSGYTFYKWVASGSGTFDDANNASTTFHPAANSEVATAQYKKIYSLSASVDNTGYTSGCSVSVDKATALAGEGYTVTITPGTDNADFESLKINSTDVTSEVFSNSYSGTASGANSDINIVAKFADHGYELRCGTTESAWHPDDKGDFSPTATAGIYTIDVNLSAGTYYLYVASNGAGQNDGYHYKTANNNNHVDLALNGSVTLEKLAGNNYGNKKGTAKFVVSTKGNYTFTFNKTTPSVSVAETTYTASAVAKGTTDGTNYSVNLGTIQSSTTVGSTTGLAVNAGTQSGYTFYKWVASGSGTFDDANNASTTFHPAANSEVATAQYKKIYSLSASVDNTGYTSGCSVSVNKATALAGEGYTVTITPGTDNAEFESLKINSTDVTSYVSSNSYLGTASGENSDINIVAKFADHGYELRCGTTESAWHPDDKGDFSPTATAGIYTIDVNLSAGTYYLYVASNGAGQNDGYHYKTANNNNHVDLALNGSVTLEKLAGNNYGGKKGTAKFVVSTEGNYTFTFNKNDTPSVSVSETPDPGGDEAEGEVEVYAKSGTLRDGNETMGSFATSALYKQNGTDAYTTTNYLSTQNWNGGNCVMAPIEKGEIFTVKTTIASAQRSNYYVKGFDINGETYGLIKDESTITDETKSAGVYTAQYEIDAETEDTKIEITPIIYKFGETRTRFYIEGFDNVPETEGWGKTIYVYPFYGNLDSAANAFKSYPGQAVITDGGKRYIDIPNTVGSTAIKGVTMSNGYWDTVHRAIEGWPNDKSAYHKQTYDYDDFYKIKQEVPEGKTLKDIIFYFKFKDGYKGSRTTEQDAGGNTAPSSFTDTTTTTWKNDWEPLTDYYGRYVDIFGTPLTDQSTVPSAANTSHIHVVSNGYVNNNAGYFGTEWNIYTYSSSKYNRITQISPSALLMKSSSSFDNYSGTKWSTYKTAYNTLNTSDYINKPVIITYENALYGGKKPDNSYDRAVRNDGRWYATYTQDTINANIKIQKIGGSDLDWTDDTFGSDANANKGTTTGARAYFTNTSVSISPSGTANLNGTVTASNVLLSNTADFTFAVDNSELSASYKFVGWFRQTATGDISSISKNSSASSSMSASDTYIARYRYTGTATVKIDHTLFPGSALGKTYVSAVVTHADGASPATTSYSETSGTLTIPMESDDKKITVTLKSTSIGDNEFRGFYTGTDSGDLIAGTDANAKVINQTTTIEILQSDVFNSNDTPKKETFNYYSKFDDVTETISVVYTYKDRFGVDKKYRAERVLDANYLEAYKDSYSGDNRRYALNTKTIVSDPGTGTAGTESGSYTIKEWIMDFAPKVEDLDKTSTWNLNSISHTDGAKTYTLTATQENKTHKVKLKFTKNGSSFTSEVLTVADDAFTKTAANGGLMGYEYNDASSNFKYWAVWSAKEDNGELVKTGEKEYARCYNRFFTLTIPEDSYIEAVYEYKEGESNGDIAAIREPVFTREISNADENGNYITDGSGKVVTTDVVYADFVVSYMTENYGVQLNTDKDKDKFDTGVIMEFNQNVSIDDNIASTITDKKFDSDLETIKSKLNTYLSDGDFGGKNYTNYSAPTNGTNSSTGKNALYYYSIDNTKYNDLNRYDYFLKFNNTNTWRKRVMKAYYYVKNTTTDDITLSDPVYFAINVIGNSEATVIGTTS